MKCEHGDPCAYVSCPNFIDPALRNMTETYPPDKTVLIDKIKTVLIELNDLEEHTDNSYRWELVKQTVGDCEHENAIPYNDHAVNLGYEHSKVHEGIMVCSDCNYEFVPELDDETVEFDPMAFYEEFAKAWRVLFKRESEWIYYIIPVTKDLDKMWKLGVMPWRDWLLNKYVPSVVKKMLSRLVAEFDTDDLLIRFEGVRGRYYAEIVIGLRFYPKLLLGHSHKTEVGK